MMRSIVDICGGAYSTVYWCIYPPTVQEEMVPNLQDCQDDLQDRLQRMRNRSLELRSELEILKTNRDKTRIRRKFLEFKNNEKDIAITENTLFTVDRQIELFERSKLDGIIIDTLRKSSTALKELKGSIPELSNVEDVTETLANRMSDVNEITQTLSTALSKGLEDDFSTLEDELEEFLRDGEENEPKQKEPVENERPHAKISHVKKSDSMSDIFAERPAAQKTRIFGTETRKSALQLPPRKSIIQSDHYDSDPEIEERMALLSQ
jgi:hypothetical protein